MSNFGSLIRKDFLMGIAVVFTCFVEAGCQEVVDSSRLKLKNFVFCQCLEQQYGESEYAALNEGSAAVYLNDSRIIEPLTILESTQNFLTTYEWRITQSKTGRNLGVAKCLDMYNSEELSSFLQLMEKYLKDE